MRDQGLQQLDDRVTENGRVKLSARYTWKLRKSTTSTPPESLLHRQRLIHLRQLHHPHEEQPDAPIKLQDVYQVKKRSTCGVTIHEDDSSKLFQQEEEFDGLRGE